MQPPRKKEGLVKHKGCEGCTKKCVFNRPCTTKNKQETDRPYGCHSCNS